MSYELGGGGVQETLVENGRIKVTNETGGFDPEASITTTINGDVIVQTDGVKTYTVTIDGDTITEGWS